MALHLLGIDVLEIIVNLVNLESKSNLFMTGHLQLRAKLSQINTNLMILPYSGTRIASLEETDEGISAVHKYTYSTDIEKTIKQVISSAITRKRVVYGLTPLHYRSATNVTTLDIHLDRVLSVMSKLKHLHIYLRPGFSHYLHSTPTTLHSLCIDLHIDTCIFTLFRYLPRTLRILDLSYPMNTYVDLTPELLQSLPRGLEELYGIVVDNDELARALPPSLIRLHCTGILNVSPAILHSALEEITTGKINVSTVSHLSLVGLLCEIRSIDSLLPLKSLTKLFVTIQMIEQNDWNSPIQFPDTLSDLTLHAVSSLCYLIPSSVKMLNLGGRYNVFELSTNTWTFKGWDMVSRIPDNVVHANLNIEDTVDIDMHIVFNRIQSTVETLDLKIGYHHNINIYEFKCFPKCTKLILPWHIGANSLPPSLTYMDVKNVDYSANGFVWPATLRHISTWVSLIPSTVMKLQLLHLECTAKLVLLNLNCISHIPEVILRVNISQKQTKLPELPSNARYRHVKH